MNKKILLTILTALFAICLVGCGNDEKQTELVNYVNNDLKEVNKLEAEMRESYNSVAGDNYTSDEEMYNEINDKTLALAKELNDKATKISDGIKDEKLKETHKIYIEFTADFSSALETLKSALENQDAAQATEASEQINAADKKGADYKNKLEKLAKEYDVEIKSK